MKWLEKMMGSLILCAVLTGSAPAQSAQEHIERARTMLQAENYTGALEQFAAAVEKDPHQVRAQAPEFAPAGLKLGGELNQRDDFAQARYWLRLVQKVDPENAEVLKELGYSCYRLRDTEEALQTLVPATALAPQDHEVWFLLGNVLYEQKQDDAGAIRSYARYIECAGTNLTIYYRYGRLLNGARRYADAMEIWRKAIEARPKAFPLWYQRGISLVGLGRTAEALQTFAEADKLERLDKPEDSRSLGRDLLKDEVLARTR